MTFNKKKGNQLYNVFDSNLLMILCKKLHYNAGHFDIGFVVTIIYALHEHVLICQKN